MGGSSKTVSQYNKEAMKPNTLKLLLIKKNCHPRLVVSYYVYFLFHVIKM